MPATILTTPTGQENLQWGTALVVEEYLYDPTVAAGTAITNGQVVIMFGGYTFSTNTTSATVISSTAVPVIRLQTTTPAFTNIGVAINAPTAGYLPGSIVQVAVEGVVQIVADANNTTYGQFLINGSTTTGAATASAGVSAGHTIAVCLQTATIGAGTALVYGKLRLI
jgi:hypothetical protein